MIGEEIFKMEEFLRTRKAHRSEFKKLLEEWKALKSKDPIDKTRLRVQFVLIEELYQTIFDLDQKIKENMIAEEVEEKKMEEELDAARDIRKEYETVKIEIDNFVVEKTQLAPPSEFGGSCFGDGELGMRLPKVQLKKFSGKYLDWLGFWAQFEKIHLSTRLTGSDKFQYLLMALEEGTEEYDIVSGFPQTDENYQDAVNALKRRFGNEDMLLQVYIRELLKLVISNVNNKEKLPLPTLFIKVDSHLRALKTLNLAAADPASWLFPLVESCLPDDVLINWQRGLQGKLDTSLEEPTKTRLDLLMEYLGKEVDIRQRLGIVREGFQTTDVGGGSRALKRKMLESHGGERLSGKATKVAGPVATLSGFQNVERKNPSCIFCGKLGHHAKDCYSAKRLSFEARKKRAAENKLCFDCLGNHGGRCDKKQRCSLCGGGHILNMCRQLKGAEKNVQLERPQQQRKEWNSDVFTQSKSNQITSGQVSLQTLKVEIRNGKKSKIARAFLDCGSQRSYILKSVAHELNLEKIGTEVVTHELFGGLRTERVVHDKFVIVIGSKDGTYQCQMEMRDQKEISRFLPGTCTTDQQLWRELQNNNINLTDVGDSSTTIDILIGADYYGLMLTGNIKHLELGAVAVETKLGWTLIGETERNKNFVENWKNIQCTSMSNTDYSVTQLWDMDTIGVRDPVEVITVQKTEAQEKQKFFANLTRNSDGRYVIKLPWKDYCPSLPTNIEIAKKRLESTTKKLKVLRLMETYGRLFQSWEEEGFIEKVVDLDRGTRSIHYIPHRAVVKPSSLTTPVRPVFDASCKVGNHPSLNDCLHKGENYILLIPEVLLRFREKAIGFIADIRKAFQTIEVEEEDRDVMRFLWWAPDGGIMKYRHKRVMFGANCSPFILGAVIDYHLSHVREHQEIGKKLLRSLYVDNCANSEETVEEYRHFRNVSTSLLADCKMDLRMWMSNVDEFVDPATHIVGVLGMQWDRKEDVLFVNVENISVPEKITKRTVLSTVQKIFDPIGFTCPALIPMKTLLQRTWVNKLKWDESLPEEEVRTFKKWMKEVPALTQIRIPRRMSSSEMESGRISLHTFTDASKTSYGAVVFLRCESDHGVSVQLLAAKARVCPVMTKDGTQKRMTIPRLELMGCLVGARLCASVKKSLGWLDIPECYWTDSSTACAWIHRNEAWGTFVGNRTNEINQLTRKEDWRHVPGTLNPADLPSRGCSPSQLLKSMWWRGPDWLYNGNMPPAGFLEEEVNEEEIACEMRQAKPGGGTVSFTMAVLNYEERQHSFDTYVRIIGWVRRFTFNCRNQIKRSGKLSRMELEVAEETVIRGIQEETFRDKEKDQFCGIEVFRREDGILYVKTRLVMRKDLLSVTTPYLLPGKHPLVRQLIMDYHRKYCHAGIGFLCVKLRRKYWILQARRSIRSVVSKCMRCRRMNAKPVVTATAPLPLDRIDDVEVFQNVGVDLAGPFMLRNGKKTWMVIFTCAVYRAVSLDLVDSLSTSAFVKCLEVFIGKYRRPSIIYSDNGTNFRGTDNLFRKLDWSLIQEAETCKPITWKFNPPSGPWWGGWWERIIRTIKDLMTRSIGKGSLSRVEFATILKDIQEILNDRPLTYISEKTEDLEPLTPNLFLKPHGISRFPEGILLEGDKLRIRFKFLETLRKELKQRFQKEYLSLLVSKSRKKPSRTVQVGELVVVGTELKKRFMWPLGRIVEVFPGKDGVTRVARVKTQDGELLRPVQRLHPLEVDVQAEDGHVMLTRSKCK